MQMIEQFSNSEYILPFFCDSIQHLFKKITELSSKMHQASNSSAEHNLNFRLSMSENLSNFRIQVMRAIFNRVYMHMCIRRF